MKTPLIDRRNFLKAAGAGFAAAMTPGAWAAALDTGAVFATAYVRHGGGYGAAVLSEEGRILYAVDLPDRGHGVTFDPASRRAVVFPRKPGTIAVAFDHTRRERPVTFACPEGRHFYGHGVFSPDGALLYATENDFDNAAGMVGVYDARDGFTKVGEFPTHGVGPHELLLAGDGTTLAIANGGIETHPDFGKAKLNLATMRPSYVLIDRISGDLLEKHGLPAKLHQLSIRHMDVDSGGTIWFSCQYEGATTDRPPLVGRAARGKDLELLDMPETALNSLRNYIGAMAANREAGTMAVSSPAGNSYVVFDTASGKVISASDMTEVCGIAPDRTGFMATSGAGAIARPDAPPVAEPDYVWDNHLLRVRG
ncbi:DUF1513 domain-containing protein [Mesorhizobium sp. SP-1A]|uniref:DUF1513 domain-containing protein n=1 Tax=Mesorhizobium sp. SP-1A TaxID=3077840 RepID=UPI0028F73E2A|nr:DUF1513 domain-containing protein [Mesorhizobium sp. SP-1A]